MENNNIHVRELVAGTKLCNGKYVIERVIGVGGFGITYFARHTILNHEYALKEFFISGKCARNTQHFTIYIEDGQEAEFEKYRKKFVAEAQTLIGLDHPGIVKVIDIFEENNTSYIVMNYVPGVTLQHIVQQNGKLPYEVAVNYIAQLCEAVGYIHERHILHRDIKPDNVMVTPQNRVVLLDFGSAREFVNDEVQNQTAILTRGYAPPEQYSFSSRKGNYTDIYALGALFYYCVTGVKPVDAASRSIEVLPEPIELNNALPQAANRTIMKAMQLKPENRHQTVAEFMEDLLGNPGGGGSGGGNGGGSGSGSKTSKKVNWPLVLGIGGGALAFVLLMLFFVFLRDPNSKPTVPQKPAREKTVSKKEKEKEVEVEEKEPEPKVLVFQLPGSNEEYRYEGDLDENGNPHGKGKAFFKDRTYEGDFNHGLLEGEGVMVFDSDNKTFSGRFERGDLVEGKKVFASMTQEGSFDGFTIVSGTEVRNSGETFYYIDGNIVDKTTYLKKYKK